MNSIETDSIDDTLHLTPSKQKKQSRLKRFLLSPVRLVVWLVSSLKWAFYGKYMYQREVRKQLRRWQKLTKAGADRSLNRNPTWEMNRIETLRSSLEVKPGTQAPEIERIKIMREKIVREPLPKPDVDDSGLN